MEVLVAAFGFLILVFSVIVHECAHGWVAEKLGDGTARALGRITLNPIPHIDPIGTLIVPGILFLLSFVHPQGFMIGWAKPVPINPYNLRDPKRSMMWISLAGAGSNIILACAFAVLARLAMSALIGLPQEVTRSPVLAAAGHFGASVMVWGVFINVLLAVFNLIPVPPLDGSKVLMGLLPDEQAYAVARLEPFGIWLVIGLIMLQVPRALIIVIALPLTKLLAGRAAMLL